MVIDGMIGWVVAKARAREAEGFASCGQTFGLYLDYSKF